MGEKNRSIGRSHRLTPKQASIIIKMPSVSIGLPVYNGENYLREALDSLLAQTYTDFELIISDNASNDATQAICEEFSARDRRVRYFRAELNHGASWNHTFVINKAKAPLFKLAAHDDVCLSLHLEKCVAALQENPDAVLAYTRTLMMKGTQSSMTYYKDEVELTAPNAALRYGDLIHEAPPAFPIFGVVRLAALKRIPGFEPYKASDRVVLTRLALMSPFIEVKEALFQYRWHDSNASNLMSSGSGFYTWWNPKKGRGLVYPESRLMWEHFHSIFIVPLIWKERKACIREWWHWVQASRKRIKTELLQPISRKPLPAYPNPGLFEVTMKRQQRAATKALFYPNRASNK
ncbi:MAG: glycosyltransferase family 2 protein [Desulfobacterales bacterium]|nr:glycosyltransferase family 2 protein [Desulfobacterales bacterium]